MMTDDALRAKVEAAEPEQIVEIAQEAGFEIDPEDLEKAARETRVKADPEGNKLSLDEMDKVAGGLFWMGEDAPDGHEMGCLATYYTWDDQKKRDMYCKEAYYCSGNVWENSSGPGRIHKRR